MWHLLSVFSCLCLLGTCSALEAPTCEPHAAKQDTLSSSLVQTAGFVSRRTALAENLQAHATLASLVAGLASSNETGSATVNLTKVLEPAPTPAATLYGIVGEAPSTNMTQASASGALAYLTQHGCHCKAAWSVEDEAFFGCTDLTFSSEIVRGCVIEESAQKCPLAQPFGGASVLFDGCTILPNENAEDQVARLQEATAEQCHCQPKWEYNGTMYHNCAFTPDADQPWCYIIEDETLCPYVAGVGLGNQRWRYCEEYLTEIIVPIVVPVDILKNSASAERSAPVPPANGQTGLQRLFGGDTTTY